MIAVIDYDMGNLKSVSKALECVGAKVCVTRDPKKIQNADKLVLPGVGAFGECMKNLENYGLVDVIKNEITKGKWFLGICLGLQLLFEDSEEFGPVKGLGILRGKVKKFVDRGSWIVDRKLSDDRRTAIGEQRLKIPHMGWNQINQCRGGVTPPIFHGIPDNSSFYFVHSYYVVPQEKSVISTTTDYGVDFCSSIQKDNIFAMQFHPEKSQRWGLEVLKNFVDLG